MLLNTKIGVSIIILITSLFLSACTNQESTSPFLTDTYPSEPEAINLLAPSTDSHTSDKQEVQADAPPVTISYVKNQMSADTEIITIALNNDCQYASIQAKTESLMKSPVRIDANKNVFFSYGTNFGKNNTFFVKLTCDGDLESVEIPVSGWMFDVLWLGDTLVFYQDKLVMIDTSFKLRELPLPETISKDFYSLGTLIYSSEQESDLVWFAKRPLLEDKKLYVVYRTVDLDTNTSTEKKVLIPYQCENEEDELLCESGMGPFVSGIDTATGNILLCVGEKRAEEALDMHVVYHDLKLYSPSKNEILASAPSCCLNGSYLNSGGMYYSPGSSGEYCADEIIRRYSDGTDLIDFSTFGPFTPQIPWRWHGSNGDYWILMNPKTLTTMDNEGAFLYEFDMPEFSFRQCFPGDCVTPGFMITSD